jgi:uncharacterized membrane-anchored protein
LLLADHHGAALLVTAGHTANIGIFTGRARKAILDVPDQAPRGEKVVDALAVATLYRNHISGRHRAAGADDADRRHCRPVGVTHGRHGAALITSN